MSSCHSSLTSKEENVKIGRENEIRSKTEEFLRSVILNLCVLEGLSGKIDLAFKVKREKLIGEVMIKLGKELLEDDMEPTTPAEGEVTKPTPKGEDPNALMFDFDEDEEIDDE